MRRAFLIVLLVVAWPFHATAADCTPSTSNADLDTDTTPAGRYYWADDFLFSPVAGTSTWIYQESNGIDGLQRHDPVVDDTCDGMIAGDTIIF